MSRTGQAAVAARPARAAGLLLHPTSLPGRFPIGDLGPSAVTMLDWMVSAGFTVWQVLPLGPTGMGDSPYNALSAFAGNPLLISPEALVADGLLSPEALPAWTVQESASVDFAAAAACKESLLRQAFLRFESGEFTEVAAGLERFADRERRAAWLDDWALYSSLKREHGGASWLDWEPRLRQREPQALGRKAAALAGEIRYAIFCQFLFFRQWAAVRGAAESRGIRILGDVPIYVAPDSADAWANSRLFDLDPDGGLRAVAGVPPDYFSADGQRWGNPLYRWDLLRAEGFAWWIARLRSQLEIAHYLRLDHFRGFVAYWRIPHRHTTARRGKWVKGPGEAFFQAVRQGLGSLPLLVEDLGEIDARVHDLRRRLDLPGMRVLQFGFGVADSDHSPHRHEPRSAVYTGTHDNDTTRGWFATAGDEERRRVLTYLGATPETVTAAMIRAAYGSVAELAILPLQDVLDLGSEARMNTPGRQSGNWSWRVRHADVAADLPGRMRDLAAATARLPAPPTLPPEGA
ncbi:MAG: 4-alpha-glucanotransferase [Thermoanaerobaculia bacterium]